MSLHDMSQSQAVDRRFQNLLHVAEDQLGLKMDAALKQLQSARDQSDLTSAENLFIHLEKKIKSNTKRL